MARKITFAALTVSGLTACGGGGATSLSAPTALNAISNAPDTVTVSYISGGDVYTISVDGTVDNAPGIDDATDFLLGDPALDLVSFDRSGNPVTGTSMYSSIGDNSAVNLIFGDDGVNTFSTAQFERTTGGPVNASGVIELTGDYVAVLTNGLDGSVGDFLDGDVMMTIDLDEVEVSGAITNRVLREPVNLAPILSVSPDDVTFEATVLSADGLFSGIATGGDLTFVAADGTFQGLVAGENLDEAVGTVSIRHNTPFGHSNETGVFAIGH